MEINNLLNDDRSPISPPRNEYANPLGNQAKAIIKNNIRKSPVIKNKIRYKKYQQNLSTITPNDSPQIIKTNPPIKFQHILNPITDRDEEINPILQPQFFSMNNPQINKNINSMFAQSNNTNQIFENVIGKNPITVLNFNPIQERVHQQFQHILNREDIEIIDNHDISNSNDNQISFELMPLKSYYTEYIFYELLNGFKIAGSDIFLAEIVIMKIHSLLNFFKNDPTLVQFQTSIPLCQKVLLNVLLKLFQIKFVNKEETSQEIIRNWEIIKKLLESIQEKLTNEKYKKEIEACTNILDTAFTSENKIMPWIYSDVCFLPIKQDGYDIRANFKHIETTMEFEEVTLQNYLGLTHVLYEEAEKIDDEQFKEWIKNYIIKLETRQYEMERLKKDLRESKKEVREFITATRWLSHENSNLEKYNGLEKSIKIFIKLCNNLQFANNDLGKSREEISNLNLLKNKEKTINIPEIMCLNASCYASSVFSGSRPFLRMTLAYLKHVSDIFEKIRKIM